MSVHEEGLGLTTVIDLPTHQRTHPKFLAKRLEIRARGHKGLGLKFVV